MGSLSSHKRKYDENSRGKPVRPKKRVRKQKAYHSSSDDSEASDSNFAPVDLNDSDDDQAPPAHKPATQEKKGKELKTALEPENSTDSEANRSSDEDEENDSEDGVSTSQRRAKSKRNDPEAFSTSMSKILSTKLSQSAREDPVLSRSREAAEASTNLADERLENKARAKLRADRKEDLERGRVKDVLGLTTGDAGEIAEEEKRLRKIAQRGVVKLFNAVRAAQVRADEALKEERKKGTVGYGTRMEKVNEMSKQGFLELINGKKSQPIEEA